MVVDKARLLEIAAKPLRVITVKVAGDEYRIKELNDLEGSKLEAEMIDLKGKYKFEEHRRRTLAKMIVDQDGNPITDDPKVFETFSRGITGSLYAECLKLQSYEPDEQKEYIKNSEGVEG